ncbi:MAG: flagellar hook-length control protein FliK [Pseudomonadota bacterium]|nr:flagellar hook-length control protein FliK [Pseudomonadota bacterium]
MTEIAPQTSFTGRTAARVASAGSRGEEAAADASGTFALEEAATDATAEQPPSASTRGSTREFAADRSDPERAMTQEPEIEAPAAPSVPVPDLPGAAPLAAVGAPAAAGAAASSLRDGLAAVSGIDRAGGPVDAGARRVGPSIDGSVATHPRPSEPDRAAATAAADGRTRLPAATSPGPTPEGQRAVDARLAPAEGAEKGPSSPVAGPPAPLASSDPRGAGGPRSAATLEGARPEGATIADGLARADGAESAGLRRHAASVMREAPPAGRDAPASVPTPAAQTNAPAGAGAAPVASAVGPATGAVTGDAPNTTTPGQVASPGQGPSVAAIRRGGDDEPDTFARGATPGASPDRLADTPAARLSADRARIGEAAPSLAPAPGRASGSAPPPLRAPSAAVLGLRMSATAAIEPEAIAAVVVADGAPELGPAIRTSAAAAAGGGGGVAAPILAASLAPGAGPALARAVGDQLSVALSRRGRGVVELRLDPPELGRVRLTLGRGEHGMTAAIVADRPEVADLLRRHADALSQSLTDAGQPRAQLSFGTGAGNGSGSGMGAGSADPGAADRGPDGGVSGPGDARMTEGAAPRRLLSGPRDGLDLRV